MKSFGKIVFRGLVTLIPLVLTFYLIATVIKLLESLLKNVLTLVLPESEYVPGLGLIFSLVFIYAFGLLLNYYVIRKFVQFGERQLLKIPLVKAIYSPLRDIVQLFSKNNRQFGKPVWVELDQLGFKAFGLVTREDFSDLGIDRVTKDMVTVYIPLSYQLGGYTFLVPKNKLTPIDLPVEKAMSLAITGWIKNS
ncbi:MAG: DUF502 domain-containing protein, partial [Pseudobdellovibrionaceae bacterium]|nr:DUF502 domain-containing protein [Pseudobdellovibrionaceae bacterium]